MDEDGPFGGGQNFLWGYGPRSVDFDSSSTTSASGEISQIHSQGTVGGSFHFYENEMNDEDHGRTSWWVWYDGKKLSERSVTNSDTDRMSLYIKTTGHESPDGDGNPGDIMHIGTYLCEQTNGCGGCPYEGPGNQHYYHYTYHPERVWVYVLLDRHPTHKRDYLVPSDDSAFNHPATDSCGIVRPMHYFDTMHQFYVMQLTNTNDSINVYIDDISFYSTSDVNEEIEPNQNDESITTVAVSYNRETDKWFMSWEDMSYTDGSGIHRNDDTFSTFEIKWSTSPITNQNYVNANLVIPEWYSEPEKTSYSNGVRLASSWWSRAWTQFELPNEIEQNYNHLYFAIKDISDADGNAGTVWPYNKTDGHDAVSPYIHTIDYYLIPEPVIHADVDQNSSINSTDAMLTLRNSLGLDMSQTNWFTSSSTGDVNCDGITNSTDAMLILRHSLGLDMNGTGWCVE